MLVSEDLTNIRSPKEPLEEGGFLRMLGVSNLARRWLLAGSSLRALVAVSIGVLSVMVMVFWWSSSPETINEAAIPTVTSSAQSVQSIPDSEPPVTEPEPEIVVHVAGAVTSPGVVSVVSGSRVTDAINAAGGPASEADLHSLNLAQVLEDGTSIVVPVVGQPSPEPTIRLPTTAIGSPIGESPGGRININVAAVDELQKLNGVGPSTAASIVKWRETNGVFNSPEDLLAVPGIGPAKLEAMSDNIVT